MSYSKPGTKVGMVKNNKFSVTYSIAGVRYAIHLNSFGLVWGFGSCHSFGVAVGLRGYGMCQMRGANRGTIFLKMRRVGHFISHVSSVMYFFQSPSCHEAVKLFPWEIFVSRVSPVS